MSLKNIDYLIRTWRACKLLRSKFWGLGQEDRKLGEEGVDNIPPPTLVSPIFVFFTKGEGVGSTSVFLLSGHLPP